MTANALRFLNCGIILAVYLFMIFVFALIYCFSLNKFYQPYIKDEWPSILEKSELTSSIQKELFDALGGNQPVDNSPETGMDHQGRMDLFETMTAFGTGEQNAVELNYVGPIQIVAEDDGEVIVKTTISVGVIPSARTLDVTLSIFDPDFQSQPGFEAQTLFAGSSEEIFNLVGSTPWIENVQIEEDPADATRSFLNFLEDKNFVDFTYVSKRVQQEIKLAGLTPRTQELLDEFVANQEGIAKWGWNSYFRMVYFSAVTITTVGYGDIVPLTFGMRMLCSAEAAIGIIWLGIFVNSLRK